ncbi:MAG: hypothetical protein KA063_02245 [Firmicutes bacterium]|nr:hypothetical protein [Bacillota bacterium]
MQSVMWKRLVDRIAAITATSMIAAVAAVVLSAVIIGGPAARAAQAKADTIDVPQLRPGMKGHGMTVFSGAEPESFDVEVIGIVRRGGQLGDMILVRVSGAAVEAAGGVAEGMSGSPVYVDGKLAGAIAYVFPGSDHFVAGVTPIADMLRMLDYPDALDTPDILDIPDTPGTPDAFHTPGALREVPAGARAAASVVVSGLSGRALGRLSKALEQFGTTVRPAVSFGLGSAAPGWAGRTGSATDDRPAGEIRPGSAIALQLAQGDVEIAAFGTVTYVEGDKFLAFGHPVLGKGTTDLAASGALVHGVIKSDSTPFKVLSSTGWVGAFTQDRLSGVAGRLGRQARVIPASVTVVDAETGHERTVSIQVAPEESLVADIFGSSALAAFDGALNRIGGGTASVELRVDLAGRQPYERLDTFWSNSDVAGASLSDAFDTVQLIANSATESVGIERITLKAQVKSDRRTAMIEKARVLQKTARPGDQVDVQVTLRVFRGPTVTRVASLVIPDDIGSGTVSLMIRGGSVNVEDELDGWTTPVEELLYMDVDDMLAELSSRPLGNDIVLELEPYLLDEPEVNMSVPVGSELRRDGVSGVESDGKAKGKDKGKGKAGEPDAADSQADTEELFSKPVSVRVPTDWVVQGVKWLTVDIETGAETETQTDTETETEIEELYGADV